MQLTDKIYIENCDNMELMKRYQNAVVKMYYLIKNQ